MCTLPLRPMLAVVLACSLALLLFLPDIAAPAAHYWGGYLLPVVLAFVWGRRRDIYLVAAFTSVLTVASYWFEPSGTLDDLLAGHLLPLLILWSVAWLLGRQQQMREELLAQRRQMQELNEQVNARTAALAAREEQLAKIFRANPGGIAITRQSDGCFLEANDAYLAMVGYTREQLIGHTTVELGILATESRIQVIDALQTQGSLRGHDLRLTNARGEPVDILYSSEQIDIDGEPCYLGLMVDITARRQLEKALSDSEERFRLIVENSPDVIALFDEQGKMVYVSPVFETTHGVSAKAALAADARIVEAINTPPDEGPRAEELARARARPQFESRRMAAEAVAYCLAHPGTKHQVEIASPLPSGELRYFDAAYQAYLRADGDLQVVGITRDITELKRAEAERLALAERWNMAAEISSIGIWDWHAGGDEVIWDERMCLLHGVTPRTAMTFAAWRTLIHPEDRAAVEAYSRKSGFERTRIPVEYRVVRPDGSLRHLLAIGGGIYDESGTPVRQLGIVMDITERKRVEEALAATVVQLREANQRRQLAVDAANIGIWNWNFADGSLEWDERMCELYGVPPEERSTGIYYELWRARVHPDDRNLADPSGGDPMDSRSRWSTTFRIVLPDGVVRYIQVNAIKEFDRDGQPLRMIGANRDVTDEKQYELLLRDTNAVLEQRVVERTAELQAALAEVQAASQLKDEFLAMISHELRTPLTGVLSLSELLADEISGPLSARQAAYVKGITESGERLLAVINGILNYTHLLSGKVQLAAERCEPAHLFAVCATSQQYKARAKGQAIAVQVDPPDLAITADAAALAEVLKRLLDNAVKFTPEGGQIGLEARPGTAPDTVDLVVWDTGTGIAPDQLDHIFHAFTQADGSLARSHEGIGLGLAIVDEMVRRMGGTIAVASTPGAGSRFTITLPGSLERLDTAITG